MKNQETLRALSKDELIALIELYSKNWLVLDGVWFQSVEQKYGMDEAMYHDEAAWRRFTKIEARRIKEFLTPGAGRAGRSGPRAFPAILRKSQPG